MPRPPNPWTDHDTQFVILCAVRYCFGRASYAPSLVQDWVRRHWSRVDAKCRALLIRDTREELAWAARQKTTLGMDCDDRDWRAFLDWMKENENA